MLHEFYHRKPEKRCSIGKVILVIAAVIGFASIVFVALKYLFEKYHLCRCDMCNCDDYDCDCDFDDDCDCCCEVEEAAGEQGADENREEDAE